MDAVFRNGQTGPMASTSGVTPTPFPPSPMLATAATLPACSAGYVLEAKWDGIRALARIDGTAELFSRQTTRLTRCFPEITDGLVEALVGRIAILDGEIVAMDRHSAVVPPDTKAHPEHTAPQRGCWPPSRRCSSCSMCRISTG